jgi:hypothetical protein
MSESLKTRWEELAEAGGYANEKAFWEGEYRKAGSLRKLERSLGISNFTVRKKFYQFSIPLSTRGGPRNVKVVFDEALLKRIATEGLKKTAVALCVAQYTLITARRKFLEKHPELKPGAPAPGPPPTHL